MSTVNAGPKFGKKKKSESFIIELQSLIYDCHSRPLTFDYLENSHLFQCVLVEKLVYYEYDEFSKVLSEF